MSLTPYQTVGPYLALGLRVGVQSPDAPADPQAITITGRLIDGAGDGITDGILEWWHPSFSEIHRSPSGADGRFGVQLRKPPAEGAGAPHVLVRVLGRGVLTQYVTRVYFAGDAGHEADPVLQRVPAARRQTIVAQQTAPNAYHFDVVLQGENETVFFDV